MSEGKIIYRTGTPDKDKEIYFDDSAHRSPESIKQFYIPLPGDQVYLIFFTLAAEELLI